MTTVYNIQASAWNDNNVISTDIILSNKLQDLDNDLKVKFNFEHNPIENNLVSLIDEPLPPPGPMIRVIYYSNDKLYPTNKYVNILSNMTNKTNTIYLKFVPAMNDVTNLINLKFPNININNVVFKVTIGNFNGDTFKPIDKMFFNPSMGINEKSEDYIERVINPSDGLINFKINPFNNLGIQLDVIKLDIICNNVGNF
jgi:hypothetical protein